MIAGHFDGAKAVADYVSVSGSLTTLDVRSNGIKGDGAEAGADADAIGLRVEPLTFADRDSPNVVDEAHVWHALHSVYDPEIPVNVVDLGLIYNVEVEDNEVHVEMTLTAQGCGMGPYIAQQAEWRIAEIEDVEDVVVDLVFEPPWNPELITEDGKRLLGID